MEKILNSGTLRLLFDFLIGVVLLVLAVVFVSAHFDMAITVLSSMLIIIGTGLFIRQDYEIIKAYKAERI